MCIRDSLKTEGAFESRQVEQWAPGERAPVVKPSDNLKPEGNFQTKPQDKWAPGKKYIHFMATYIVLLYCACLYCLHDTCILFCFVMVFVLE